MACRCSLEELTKSVMESAGEDSVVPATLKDSLMARLDRLGEAREVAQIASVIGRQFTFALLDAVILGGRTDVEAALAKLVAAGIVFPEGRSSERSFSFRHALVRDVAYESLLLSRRREWHERIARALEERFPELATSEPELLAQHFGEAGLADPACDYRMRAGDWAVSRSAYHGGDRAFLGGSEGGRGLAGLGRVDMRRQLDLLLKLGPALMVGRGMQSAEVEEVYRRAAEIGERLDDSTGDVQSQMGPVAQRQCQAQDRPGARPGAGTGDARATFRRRAICCSKPIIAAGRRLSSAAMSRRRWAIARSVSRPMTWTATVILALPSAVTIRAFARTWCAPTRFS